jgi:glutamate dehydrogenase/leucine dehydrogenase
MRVVIAGCGRVGSDLALTLSEEGHDVSVIDSRPGVFERLGSTFNGTTHEGLGYDVKVLKGAALQPVMLAEGCLHRMELAVLGQPLDGGDRRTVVLQRQRRA